MVNNVCIMRSTFAKNYLDIKHSIFVYYLLNINRMSGLSLLKVTGLVYDLQVLGFKCRKPEMDSADPDSDSNCCKFP